MTPFVKVQDRQHLATRADGVDLCVPGLGLSVRNIYFFSEESHYSVSVVRLVSMTDLSNQKKSQPVFFFPVTSTQKANQRIHDTSGLIRVSKCLQNT